MVDFNDERKRAESTFVGGPPRPSFRNRKRPVVQQQSLGDASHLLDPKTQAAAQARMAGGSVAQRPLSKKRSSTAGKRPKSRKSKETSSSNSNKLNRSTSYAVSAKKLPADFADRVLNLELEID